MNGICVTIYFGGAGTLMGLYRQSGRPVGIPFPAQPTPGVYLEPITPSRAGLRSEGTVPVVGWRARVKGVTSGETREAPCRRSHRERTGTAPGPAEHDDEGRGPIVVPPGIHATAWRE